MSLKEKLLEDMKTAMREKNKIKKDSIQMVRAAVLQVEKDKKTTLEDEDIIEVIAKEVKRRKDALAEFEKSQRQDLIENVKTEIELLTEYLPQQLTEEEVEVIVKETISEIDISSMKQIGI